MLHIIINGTRYNIATDDRPNNIDRLLTQTAQAAMLEAGLTGAAIRDFGGDETGDTLPDEIDEKVWALAEALGCSVLSNIGYDGHGSGPDGGTSDDEPGEYWVLDSSERDEAANDALDSYLDECILSQIPDSLRSYFDGDSWKEDALNNDGYGHTISGYDGEEHEVCIDGMCFYIYRIG